MLNLTRKRNLIIRAATPAETEDVELLARWSDRVHLRFQINYLPQLVRDGHIMLVLQNGNLCGLSYATIDYPNCSIRGLAVRPGRSTPLIVEAMLNHLLPAAKAANALSITYIGDDSWLVPSLVERGFVRSGQIIGLRRSGTFLAAEVDHHCQVRCARAEDVEAIVAVDWAAFEPLWRNGVQTIREFLAQMPHFLVSTMDGQIVAYICGTCYNRVGHVVRLAVHKQVQRRGIGTMLMRELLARMADEGVRGLTLNTQLDNYGSQAFYRSLGFYPTQKPASVYRYMLANR